MSVVDEDETERKEGYDDNDDNDDDDEQTMMDGEVDIKKDVKH